MEGVAPGNREVRIEELKVDEGKSKWTAAG